jgi:hypothetical protein
MDVLVRDRPLDHQDERCQFTARGGAVRPEELLAAESRREHFVIEIDFRQAGDQTEDDILDCRLSGCGDRHRVAVAAHPFRDPQDVHFVEA